MKTISPRRKHRRGNPDVKLSVSMGGQSSIFLRIMKIRLEIEGKNAGSINYKGADCIDLAVAYLNSIEADEVQVHLVKDDGTRADAEFEGEFPVISAMKFILAASKTRHGDHTQDFYNKQYQ